MGDLFKQEFFFAFLLVFFIYFELFVQRFGRWSFSINCSRPGTGWHSCCSLKNVKDKNHEQTGVFNLLKVASLLHILFSVMKLNSKQVFSFYRCFQIVSEKYNRSIDLCVNLTTLILRWVFLIFSQEIPTLFSLCWSISEELTWEEAREVQ